MVGMPGTGKVIKANIYNHDNLLLLKRLTFPKKLRDIVIGWDINLKLLM